MKPGDIPRTLTIDERAFADGAIVNPACTANDFASATCSTQLNDSGAPIDVLEALAHPVFNENRRRSYVHGSGELVLTFSDFLPTNNAGPDLVVFQGFVAHGFAIKVRTREGDEYPATGSGFLDVGSTPVIQIPGFDAQGFGWGPCLPGFILSTCNLVTPGNSNFSSNLLLYEIDLDQLGVPAGVAIDVVTIKKQTTDQLGTVPNLVLVGATNTFEVAPELSEFIRNGRFDEGADGLDHWAVVGGGTVDVGPSFTTLTAPGTPVALTQIINTPNQSFQIIFDRRFMTSAGTLLISLNGLVIHKLAGSQDTWVREEIYVNDVSLMGLQGVEFKLELLPGSDAAAAVWNIGIPEGRDLSPPNVSFELTTSNSYNREPSGEQW